MNSSTPDEHRGDVGGQSETLEIETDDRILLIDRSGSGNVYFILVSPDNNNNKRSDQKSAVNPSNLDLYSEKWEQLHMVRDFGICWHKHYLYVIGGYDLTTNSYLDTFRRYHTIHDIWEDLAPLHHARSNFGTVICNGRIYITGGVRSKGKATKSCEAFNLTTMVWERVGLMPHPRKDHQVTSDGTTVYISGGSNNDRLYANLWLSEDYSWNKMDDEYPISMSTCRALHTMECHNGFLYFIGGLTVKKTPDKTDTTPYESLSAHPQHQKINFMQQQQNRSKTTAQHFPRVDSSMESFMPYVTSSVTDESNFISPWDWGLPSLKQGRYGAASLIIGEELYVMGGTGVDNLCVPRAEVYNFKSRVWTDNFLLSSCNVGNVSSALVKCTTNRRKLHALDTPDYWSQYKWILW